MKKLAALLIILVYSFASAGATIAMHYCMGERVSTNLGFEEQSICEFCHMEKHSGDDLEDCCKDENTFIKVSSDQNVSVFSSLPDIPVLNSGIFFYTSDLLSQTSLHFNAFVQRVEPPDIPVYMLHCNYRI